jgi:hypothetical protein
MPMEENAAEKLLAESNRRRCISNGRAKMKKQGLTGGLVIRVRQYPKSVRTFSRARCGIPH